MYEIEGGATGPALADHDHLVVRLRAAGCVFAEEEAQLLLATAGSADELELMVSRRVAGEPLEQVVGWAELLGRRISVDRGVFVPRRRTELLVREALRLLRVDGVVVELCCGSGAVAVVLTSEVAGLDMRAVDIEPAAVRCARGNLGSRAQVYLGDLFEPLPQELAGRVDLVVANAPYVPTREIRLLPAEARLHEPTQSLDGGVDGLEVLRRVVSEAPRWLTPGGHVLVETSEEQAAALMTAMSDGYGDVRTISDDDLGATVVLGTTT